MEEIHLQGSLFGAPQVEATNDDWYTPKWIFKTMGIGFDLDVAAPPGGIDWIPAKRYFTKEDDGLNQAWQGRVWMNPPFSAMTPWALRFLAHQNGIALVPLTHNRWSQEVWKSDCRMVSLPHDLKFMRAGKPMGIQFPALLIAFTDECIDAISRIGKVR